MLTINGYYSTTFRGNPTPVGERVVDRLEKALAVAYKNPKTHKVHLDMHRSKICIERKAEGASTNRTAIYNIMTGKLIEIKRPIAQSEKYYELVTYVNHDYYKPGYKLKEKDSFTLTLPSNQSFETLKELLDFTQKNNVTLP